MRLIDADALLGSHWWDSLTNEFDKARAKIVVMSAPTVDAVEVVHGQWVQVICYEEFEDGFVDRVKECCSVCHIPNGRRASNYCPNCGAKMDGGNENAAD